MRSTVHLPSGTSQVSRPSLVHFGAQVHDLALRHNPVRRIRRVRRKNSSWRVKAAFPEISSMRGAACSSTCAQAECP